jgi:hypothetical protein
MRTLRSYVGMPTYEALLTWIVCAGVVLAVIELALAIFHPVPYSIRNAW